MKGIFYQFISNFFLPPVIHLFILTVGLILIFRKKTLNKGKKVLIFGTVLFYISCSPSLVHLLSRPLESSFNQPDWEEILPSFGAIVVLTGGKFYTRLRTLRGVELYYRFQDIPILFSGGTTDPKGQTIAESEKAAQIAGKLGVPEQQIFVETQSRDTHENAIYTLKILQEKNIDNFLLVTSGIHMYRAMAVFRKNGYNPIPVPSDYISGQSDKWISFPYSILPSMGAFHSLFYVLHEYIGLVWYKIRGYL